MSLVKEIIVDPYRRLKWGFIPVKRNVEDITEFNSDSIKDDSTSTTSLPSEKIKDQKFTDVEVVEDIEYEYRDEANRKWWNFFNEQEYRINQKQNATNKWYQWFADDTSYAEKKLLIKLDILLAFYSCIAYWIKYLDTVNLNNAYVSGMKEELGFKGNDLVNTQVMYTIGNIVFQIPYLFCLHRIPLNYVLPFLDISWSLLTIGAAYVNSVSHLKVIRFFIGAFEAPSYLAYQYLFGSFYKHDEMVRRSAFYYLGQYIGILSAGGIQSAVYESLNGRNGLSGWRWNFIIDAIVSIVVGIIGFYSLPGDPHNCYSIFLTDDEIRLARKRVKENQTAKVNLSDKFVDPKVWKSIIFDWKIYVLTLWNVFCWNNNNGSSGAYLLWLKSLKRYSIPKINKLSMITPGIGMIYLMGTSFIADKFHSRWLAIIITQIFNFTGNVILAVWDVEEGAKWFAFMLQYFGWAMAPVLYSWQNDICRRDVHSRAVILVVMNMLAQTSTAWINVLVWKTSEAPRFPKGFIWVAVASFCLSIWTFVVLYFYKRDEKRNAKENGIIIYNSAKGETPKQVEVQES